MYHYYYTSVENIRFLRCLYSQNRVAVHNLAQYQIVLIKSDISPLPYTHLHWEKSSNLAAFLYLSGDLKLNIFILLVFGSYISLYLDVCVLPDPWLVILTLDKSGSSIL